MKYKFIEEVKNEAGLEKRSMLIYSEIYKDDGLYFASEMRYLAERYNQIDVRINSIGGSVFAAFGMVSTILDLRKQGIKINTYNDGIAGSAAGWLFQAGEMRYAADFSLLMMHDPYNPNDNSGEMDEVDQLIKSSILKVLASKTKLTEDQVSEMMSKDEGEGTWMDAQEQLSTGFADELFSTSLNKEVTNLLNKESSLEEILNITNSLYKKKDSKVKKDMNKLNAILELQNEASEDAQVAAIQNLANKAAKTEELQRELATANSKVTDLENQIQEANQAQADSLVEQAIKEGKVDEAGKEVWLNMAKGDYEGTKAALASITATKDTFVNAVAIPKDQGNRTPLSNAAQELEDAKEYENLFKNDSASLAVIKEQEPERYNRMQKAYNNKIKTSRGRKK